MNKAFTFFGVGDEKDEEKEDDECVDDRQVEEVCPVRGHGERDGEAFRFDTRVVGSGLGRLGGAGGQGHGGLSPQGLGVNDAHLAVAGHGRDVDSNNVIVADGQAAVEVLARTLESIEAEAVDRVEDDKEEPEVEGEAGQDGKEDPLLAIGLSFLP